MEKDVTEPQNPQQQTTVRIPLTDREVTVPTAITIPLLPVWNGVRWLATRLDRLARDVAQRMKERD